MAGPRKQSKTKKKKRHHTSALDRLPVSTASPWVVDLRPLPESADVARLYECLVVMEPTGLMRAVALLVAPATPDEIIGAMREALTAPSAPLKPARPRAIATSRPELAEALRPLALEAGFAISVNTQIDVRPFLADLAASLGQVTECTITGAPYDDEARLAQAAARYAAVAPWRFVGEDVVYEIIAADRPLTHRYAMVLGAAGLMHGLALYQSLDQVAAARRGGPRSRSGFENVASLSLDPPDEIDEAIRLAFARRGLALSDGRYPSFTEVIAGTPGPIETPALVTTFEDALHALACHFEQAVSGPVYTVRPRTVVPLAGRDATAEIIVFRHTPERARTPAAKRSNRGTPTPEASPMTGTLFLPDDVFTFEVSLDGIEPRIWRRFTLPTDATFGELHAAIQAFGGWYDAHLFEFYAGSGRSRTTIAASDEYDPFDGDEAPDAYLTPLTTYFSDRRRRSCRYLYDFGDDWRLTVKMTGVVRAPAGGPHAQLLAGARAFPAEDCGGLPGYDECVAVVREPEHDPERAEWLGDWDPERFDLAALQARYRPRSAG